MREIIISKNEEGIRLDKYLKKIFTNAPVNLLYKLIRKKYFEINGKKANGDETLKSEDKIAIYLSDETYDKFIDKNLTNLKSDKSKLLKGIKDKIIYEDDNLIIFNKDVGILSQSNEKNGISVNSILNDYLGESVDPIYKPSVVNRLDRNTAGIIIFAKTYMFGRAISSMIKNEEIDKYYVALVDGIVRKNELRLIHLLKKNKTINKVIIKDYNKNEPIPDGYSKVELVYKVIKKYDDKTLLGIKLITGKTHQIRAQLAYIGFPILGERKYKIKVRTFDEREKKAENKDGYQKLMCYKIKFHTFENEKLKYLDDRTFEIDIDKIKEMWHIE